MRVFFTSGTPAGHHPAESADSSWYGPHVTEGYHAVKTCPSKSLVFSYFLFLMFDSFVLAVMLCYYNSPASVLTVPLS